MKTIQATVPEYIHKLFVDGRDEMHLNNSGMLIHLVIAKFLIGKAVTREDVLEQRERFEAAGLTL